MYVCIYKGTYANGFRQTEPVSIRMYVYICIYMYVCMYIYIQAPMRTALDRQSRAYTCTYECMYMYICVYVCICIKARIQTALDRQSP
jgi:hypothetical protein